MRIVAVPHGWSSVVRIVTSVTAEDVCQFLTAAERAEVESLKVPERRLERAASRIAGKLLLGERHPASEIEFRKDGDRPLATLGGSPAPFSISFTHSHGLGAAAAADSPVGVDLERFREIRREMTRFFLSPAELDTADALDILHPLLHFWSAKEAAFKMTGQFPTLLKTPLELVHADTSGLTFDVPGQSSIVETRIIETEFVVAVARSGVAMQLG